MAHLWLNIAKNEIRLWTSRYRNHRPLFFVILSSFMIFYAFFLVPLILNAFYTPIHNILIGFGPALPYFMYFVLSFAVLYIFLWCITYPISTTLQYGDDLSGQLEVLLSSPIKPQDILFGKFIGRLPIYLILLFAIVPWLVNFLIIAIPIPIFAQILIYLVLFLVLIIGMWSGNLLGAFVESKIRKSEKTRDLGKAVSFIIAIITVIIMYVTIWIISTGLSDPSSPLYIVLQFIPSSWGSSIIISLYGFGYILPIHVGFFVLGLVALTVGILYFGYRSAGRFYSLEPVATTVERITGKENRFYRFFRSLGGVPFI
ncbi:MAG TPA: ABC transporter permease, partial [Candidatus Deferrimicrobium sp.]|nr:ABC transporter permease [Candidatus Deferrimicrobium sp.]